MWKINGIRLLASMAVFVGWNMTVSADATVHFVRQELSPMPDCPNEQTDRFTPPDVRPEALFETSDIDFATIEGWTAEFIGGEGQFYLSDKQAIRGLSNARIEMRADADAARIILRPPSPVTIDHAFDTVEAWVYGAYHENVALTVRFEDGSGEKSFIKGGDQTWTDGGMIFSNWMLYRNRDPARVMSAQSRLTEIEIGPLKKGNYLFTLDALRLTKFDLTGEAPRFDNAGPEIVLPVTPRGACPATRDQIVTRVFESDGAYVFEYVPADSTPTVRYILWPGTGTLDDLSVEIAGRGTFRPAAGSGPELIHDGKTVDPVSDAGVPRQCLARQLDHDAVELSWAFGQDNARTVVDYRFFLMGKSLAVDVKSDSPTVSRWRFGHADGLSSPRVIETPYRRLDANVLLDRGMFTGYVADWYVSNVSTLPYYGEKRVENDRAWYAYADAIEGAYSYLPRTDGSRWPFKERFYIAVSSHYDEVLPTINNPPSPLKDVLKRNVYLLTQDHGEKFPMVKEYMKRCVDLGMTHTYFLLHAGLWSNRGGRGPEPFIGRTRVSESFDAHGGTQAMVDFLSDLKRAGLRVGYYEGYAFMQPIADYFRRDWLAFNPDGDWQATWVQALHPKPKAFAEYSATVSRTRREIFGADVVYMDGWTANLPFEFSDYDHRYADSGRMMTTIQDIARGFRNLRQTFDGPAFTEGSGRHYHLAGLVDGSYAQTFDFERKKTTPLFVDFELRKTHELGGDLGMGSCSFMFTSKARPDVQDYYDFVASEIAFGHVGLQEPYAYFSLEPEVFRASLLTYFMVQQLQEQYVMEPVDQIRYFDGEKLIDTDQAIAREVHLQSRVYIKYRNGLQIWINCNPDGQSWIVEADGKSYELPKGGWLAKGKDLLEFSAIIDGRRVDYSDGPNYLYVDPGPADLTWNSRRFPGGVVSVRHKQGALAGRHLQWTPSNAQTN